MFGCSSYGKKVSNQPAAERKQSDNRATGKTNTVHKLSWCEFGALLPMFRNFDGRMTDLTA